MGRNTTMLVQKKIIAKFELIKFQHVHKKSQCCFARVGGVDIPQNKLIEYSLQYIYGIGQSTAKTVLKKTGLTNKRTYSLEEEELQMLRDEVDKLSIEGERRRSTALNIKRLKEIGCYRGRRHIMGLPLNGQRTKTNARTLKGKRKTVAGKKLARK